LWVQQQATNLKIFLGDKNAKPSKHQLKLLTDILNAVGWNNGLRSPSKSLEPKAWWKHDDAETNPTFYQSLLEVCRNDQKIKYCTRLPAGWQQLFHASVIPLIPDAVIR